MNKLKLILKKYMIDGKDYLLSFLLGFYFFLMPFEEALATPYGTVLRFLGIIIIAYAVIKYFNVKFEANIFIIFSVIWVLYMLLSSVWSHEFDWWLYFIKIYLGQMLFMLALIVVPHEKYDFRVVDMFIIFTALVAALFLILFPDEATFTGQGRRTIVINGTELDPNIVSSIIAIGLLIVLKRIITNKKIVILSGLLLALILMVGIFFTGSRGGFIAVIISSAIYLFFMAKKNAKMKKIMKIAIPILIVAIACVLPFLPKSLVQRFSLKNLLGLEEFQTGTHTRPVIWRYALTAWQKVPIFGFGCGNFFYATDLLYLSSASHNMYILNLVEGGIVGLIIFLIPLIWLFKKIVKEKMYFEQCLFIFILFIGFLLDNLTYKYYWFVLLYLYISLHNKMKTDECLDYINVNVCNNFRCKEEGSL